jgi:hypothetical protein
MKVDQKIELASELLKQSKQVNEIVDELSKKIPEVLKKVDTKTKLDFYSKMNNTLNKKLNTLSKTVEG